ncbi:MAG: DUF1800 domain-containing protein [Vicinamibacterales bacterium]
MAQVDPAIGHLLRRAGFGISTDKATFWNQQGVTSAINHLVDYESVPGDVDDHIGDLGYLGTTSRGLFEPSARISDARQRWLFRLVHTQRPLQEKMALFWHNHFATGYSKIAGQLGAPAAVRALAAKPSDDQTGVTGQLELFREFALGNFRDLLLRVSQDPAMVAWLDGDTNLKDKPQENYARELMELFTMGVDFYTESDVYEGARVFTGWNLRRRGMQDDRYAQFFYNDRQHDTGSKSFSFAIYPDGGKTISERPAASGMQDGIDFVNAVARHPETGPRLARKLYAFFVNELTDPDDALVQQLAATYYQTGFNMREVVRQLLRSAQFQNQSNHWARYSWPTEFVARLITEVGWTGFSAIQALTPLANMGQTLFEPPDVAGWPLGRGWFSTGTMLARMNFASTLAQNQRFELQGGALDAAGTPESFLSYFLDRMSLPPLDPSVRNTMLDYLRTGGGWTGSSSQVATKGAGLVHLLGASSEYQFA